MIILISLIPLFLMILIVLSTIKVTKIKESYKLPDGPAVYCDIDSTLILWNQTSDDPVVIDHGGIKKVYYIHKYNLNHLKELAGRGHIIVLWSKAGSSWANAVAKALEINEIVQASMSKPSIYMDDLVPEEWIGERHFYHTDGKRLF